MSESDSSLEEDSTSELPPVVEKAEAEDSHTSEASEPDSNPKEEGPKPSGTSKKEPDSPKSKESLPSEPRSQNKPAPPASEERNARSFLDRIAVEPVHKSSGWGWGWGSSSAAEAPSASHPAPAAAPAQSGGWSSWLTSAVSSAATLAAVTTESTLTFTKDIVNDLKEGAALTVQDIRSGVGEFEQNVNAQLLSEQAKKTAEFGKGIVDAGIEKVSDSALSQAARRTLEQAQETTEAAAGRVAATPLFAEVLSGLETVGLQAFQLFTKERPRPAQAAEPLVVSAQMPQDFAEWLKHFEGTELLAALEKSSGEQELDYHRRLKEAPDRAAVQARGAAIKKTLDLAVNRDDEFEASEASPLLGRCLERLADLAKDSEGQASELQGRFCRELESEGAIERLPALFDALLNESFRVFAQFTVAVLQMLVVLSSSEADGPVLAGEVTRLVREAVAALDSLSGLYITSLQGLAAVGRAKLGELLSEPGEAGRELETKVKTVTNTLYLAVGDGIGQLEEASAFFLPIAKRRLLPPSPAGSTGPGQSQDKK